MNLKKNTPKGPDDATRIVWAVSITLPHRRPSRRCRCHKNQTMLLASSWPFPSPSHAVVVVVTMPRSRCKNLKI
jgi:hypothetical protein